MDSLRQQYSFNLDCTYVGGEGAGRRPYLQAGRQLGSWQSAITHSFSQATWSCYNYLSGAGDRYFLGLLVVVVGEHCSTNVGSAVHSQCCRLILHLHMKEAAQMSSVKMHKRSLLAAAVFHKIQ